VPALSLSAGARLPVDGERGLGTRGRPSVADRRRRALGRLSAGAPGRGDPARRRTAAVDARTARGRRRQPARRGRDPRVNGVRRAAAVVAAARRRRAAVTLLAALRHRVAAERTRSTRRAS